MSQGGCRRREPDSCQWGDPSLTQGSVPGDPKIPEAHHTEAGLRRPSREETAQVTPLDLHTTISSIAIPPVTLSQFS